MKNTLIALFALLLIVFSTSPLEAEDRPPFDGAKSALFAELLGNGLLFTLNYDTRISNRFGIRGGIGYIGSLDGEGGILTIPINANFLLGNNGKYFEVGAGFTFVGGDFFDTDNRIATSLTFMYRSQPQDGGFMWRAGFAPLIIDKIVIPYYVGLGLGYSF
nr:hypothetical protein [Saprospiraceae bacterium]